MRYDDFLEKVKAEAKSFSAKKKVPTRPETQFEKGALFAWHLLMEAKDIIYYEEMIRSEVENRMGEVPAWTGTLIHDLAEQMVERDEETDEIRSGGRTWDGWDKNGNPKKEQNPHVNLKKETVRSIGILREHLGLSFKATPRKITENTRKGGSEQDRLATLLDDIKNID